MQKKKPGVKFTFMLPAGVYTEVKQLAERVGCSDSAAARILLLRGLESMNESKNPFKK